MKFFGSLLLVSFVLIGCSNSEEEDIKFTELFLQKNWKVQSVQLSGVYYEVTKSIDGEQKKEEKITAEFLPKSSDRFNWNQFSWVFEAEKLETIHRGATDIRQALGSFEAVDNKHFIITLDAVVPEEQANQNIYNEWLRIMKGKVDYLYEVVAIGEDTRIKTEIERYEDLPTDFAEQIALVKDQFKSYTIEIKLIENK